MKKLKNWSKPLLEQIFLFLKSKKPLYTYKKVWLRPHFSIIKAFWLTNALKYVISRVLNQTTLDQLSFNYVTHGTSNFFKSSKIKRWYPIVYIFKKMILIEIWYKTHNQKLQTIVEAFKTQHHYLEGYKYKAFIFTNHNNLYWFINTKSLNFHQIC